MNKERLERYSLTGPENRAAVAVGLARGDWFRSAVPRKRMKELMRRSDYPAVRDTIIWLGLMGLFAGLGIAFWGSWRAVPFFLAYGLLYGSTSDSRWHEAGHGTSPGSTRSRPSKKPATCSGLRRVYGVGATWFHCRTASITRSPLTSLVEWVMAR